MKKRSRVTLVVLAMVMALVVSSCWQIRRVGVNSWEITVSDRSTVTLDLAKSSPNLTFEGYPFVLVGFGDNLRNAGKKWDVQGNFGGPETGVKDTSLKLSLINGDAACGLGSANIDDIASGYDNWVAFRTSSVIDLTAVSTDTILRFKHTLGVASGAAVPSVDVFMYITGIWLDDGDLVAEPLEVVCQSNYSGTISVIEP